MQFEQQQQVQQAQQISQIENYKIIKKIGEGLNAKVKIGTDVKDQKPYAVKIFKKTHTFEQNKESLTKEFQIMQGLCHPNLINIVDIKPNAIYKKKKGGQYETMAIIQELAKAGELFEFVAQSGCFKEEVARAYFHQIIAGLEYIHSKGVCHRDMKPENLLFDENFSIKIADFGFATALEGKDGQGKLYTQLGTESYMAPEIHLNKPYNGTQVDLFATAIILFIMLTGHPPFMKADQKDPYYKLIITGKHNVFWKAHSRNKPGGEKFFSPELQNFLSAMLAFDPNQRPSIEEIKKHVWYNLPIPDQNQLTAEFKKRNQVVQSELDRQREEAKKQKQNSQNQQQTTQGFAFRGRAGIEDISSQIDGIKQKYGLDSKRILKEVGNKSALTQSDFVTPIDADYLLNYLLLKQTDFCNDIFLENNQGYKITCVKKVLINPDNLGDLKIVNQVKFQLEIQKVDADNCLVNFNKVQGSSIDYFAAVDKVKQIILKL